MGKNSNRNVYCKFHAFPKWLRQNNNIREPNNSSDISLRNIKDEFFLLSFVIVCSGLIFIDAYFQRFGFRYQQQNISTMHIIYKGLTMVINSRFIITPYILTILLSIFEVYAIQKKIKYYLRIRTPFIYFFLFINLIIIYPLSQRAGANQAISDIYKETSNLPKIKTIISPDIIIRSDIDNKTYLLFLVDNDFVTFFTPLNKDEKNAYPIIKRIAKRDITLIETYF